MTTMEGCFFKDVLQCEEDSGILTTAGKARIETIIRCSKSYKDGIDTGLEEKLADDPSLTIQCHRNCVSTYTSRHHISRHLKRKGETEVTPHVSPKRRRSSVDSNFSFLRHCLFCGSDCNVEKPAKNPGRWRKAYIFRQVECAQVGKSLKEHLLEKCDERKDKWAGEVRIRIQGAVSDLHAADARYHLDCRARFVTERAVKDAASTSTNASSDSDEAFTYVVKTMEADMSKLWNSVELFQLYEGVGGDRQQRKQLVKPLKSYFGEDLAVLSASGLANVLVFKSKAPKLIGLVNDEDDESIDTSVSIVAKQIVKEVKSIETHKSKYDIRLTD